MKLNRRTFFKGVLASVVAVVTVPALPKPALPKPAEAELDYHSECARKVFGAEFTPEQRDIAKRYNFYWLYGGSSHSFQTWDLHREQTWLYKRALQGKWDRSFGPSNQQFLDELRANRKESMRNCDGGQR